jgi:hypothetical protein
MVCIWNCLSGLINSEGLAGPAIIHHKIEMVNPALNYKKDYRKN